MRYQLPYVRPLLIVASLSFYGFTAGGGASGGGLSRDPSRPQDWTLSVVDAWFCEEATNQTALDSGRKGEDNIAEGGTGDVERSATQYMQGLKSCYSTYTPNDPFLTCTDAGCPGSDFTTGQAAVTLIWWSRVDTLPTARNYGYFRANNNAAGLAVGMDGVAAGDPTLCRMMYPSSTTEAVNDLLTRATNTWYHEACTYDDQGTNMVITPWWNLQADTAASVAQNYTASSANIWIADAETTNLWVDEIIVDDVLWTAEELGRQCSIGVEGLLGACDPGTPTNYRACNNNSDCGGVAVCDSGASAIDDTYCVEGSKAGCCMGRNSTYCNGQQLTACNAGAPE